jgi:hypothetical protein
MEIEMAVTLNNLEARAEKLAVKIEKLGPEADAIIADFDKLRASGEKIPRGFPAFKPIATKVSALAAQSEYIRKNTL